VRDKCFQKCITRPGSSMSNSEVQCLANCCDRYIDVCARLASVAACMRARRAAGGRLSSRFAQATKVVAGKLDTVQKAAEKEQGFGGGLH
jgi:hypothetical protein